MVVDGPAGRQRRRDGHPPGRGERLNRTGLTAGRGRGSLGDQSNPDAAIWSSADGKQWRFDTIKDSRLTGPGYQHLSTLAGLGGDLVAVGEAYTQSGQSLVVLRQPQT